MSQPSHVSVTSGVGQVTDAKKIMWTKGARPRLRQIHTRMSGAYFHRGITRLRAEEFLLGAKEDGSFLVRDSETLAGAFVLCLLYQSRVHQYRVLPGADGKLSVQAEGGNVEPKYNNLNELIADYIKKGDKNGLIYAMKVPVSPERGEDPDTDEDDFEDIGLMQQQQHQVKLPSYVNISLAGDSSSVTVNGPTQRLQMELLKNFSRLNLTDCDTEFTDVLKKYIDKGLDTDVTASQSGETTLPEYQSIIEGAARGLKRELESFMKKMAIFDELLDIPNVCPGMQQMSDKHKEHGSGIPAMLELMSNCTSDVMTLESKVQDTVRYYAVSHYDYVEPETEDKGVPDDLTPFLSPMGKPVIPRIEFEVKTPTYKQTDKITSKMTLTIDIPAGKMFAVKPSKEILDSNSLITHDRIVQLIKSSSDNCRLDLIYDTKKKMTFIFNSALVRENFCHRILQMKNMHSKDVEVDQISIFIGTWNMGDSQPLSGIAPWLRCKGCSKVKDPQVLSVIPHDLYVIGTQESAQTDKDWVNFLKKNIKSNFLLEVEVVEVCTLWGIRLVILLKKELMHNINRVQRSTVRTGIANALGNKGGVGISFYFRGTSFCFVNTHLTSGDERNARRNQNFKDIIKGLSLGQKHLGLTDITNQFHHLFWLGDLNYRVEEDIQVLLRKLDDNDIKSLLAKDQLRRSQKEHKGFNGFQEAEIFFKPTYRLPRSERKWIYDWKKVKKTGVRINTPSWCDRVLWRSYPGTYIQNLAYGCADSVLGSDHRPVFALFNTGIASDFVMNRDSLAEESPTKIVFQQIEAELITYCRQTFQLEFQSTCLPEVVTSKPNSRFKDCAQGFTCPFWGKQEIPTMKPLFGDEDFLKEQHILISVRSKCGDNESYGECVVEMKGKFDLMPQVFEFELLHQGEVTGTLRGQLQVLTGPLAVGRKNSKKSYELIALDTEYHDPELWHPESPKSERRERLSVQLPNLDTDLPVYEVIDMNPAAGGRQHKGTKSPADRPPALLPRPVQEETQNSRSKTQPYMGQASLQTRQVLPASSTLLGSEVTSHTRPPDIPPPPLPKKSGVMTYPDHAMRYDSLKRPSSVTDWLLGLSLPEYIERFIKNGFDTLHYVTNISSDDLNEIGIDNPVHQSRIINSLRDMK
ncbi:Phosphatidylinositol 3,4,5-trisphosphate 5-phosphatase 2 [Mizuhopecten yessoensis]|uniref:phosphatidylinositol-3,4,5-trisphosphate 5-phosphatase n=1 Tax=Mizuhopecten yessoensis TaxID=6573 RepID=A0A210PWQ3_MIZYE|nr:Phosphatidylinositol 3,4,5-trisphosphate 5-phosphatase 2 [Mizuhopecten yessoensis]